LFCVEKTRTVGLPDGEKSLRMYNRFDRILACDGRSDGQTSCHGILCAMHMRRAVKIVFWPQLSSRLLNFREGKQFFTEFRKLDRYPRSTERNFCFPNALWASSAIHLFDVDFIVRAYLESLVRGHSVSLDRSHTSYYSVSG